MVSAKFSSVLAVAAAITAADAFSLTARVTRLSTTPSADGMHAYPFAIGGDACNSILVLSPEDTADFFADGTTVQTTLSTGSAGGIVVRLGGTATVPAAFPLTVECGAATEGVALGTSTSNDQVLGYAGGSWMACQPKSFANTLGDVPSGSLAIVFRQAGQRTLVGCSDIDLVSA